MWNSSVAYGAGLLCLRGGDIWSISSVAKSALFALSRLAGDSEFTISKVNSDRSTRR